MARTLNLGILAHVDAGKTSLTERLLHAAGVIDEIGSVDAGTTRTDSMELERRRGITIKAAVVSFPVADVTVNLFDTPGHPDFIAEVERTLAVLDGVVLVVSAVEGVQPQTRVLMRALRRLRLPTVLFVNKMDRSGADPERVLAEIATKLAPEAFPVDSVYELKQLDLWDDLAADSRRGTAHPVFFGSAITGSGVPELLESLTELLPADKHDADAPLSGTVFKVERGTAYVYLQSGTLRVRDRLPQGRVTGLTVFSDGAAAPTDALTAGRVGTIRGLDGMRIGDVIGESTSALSAHHFAPPTLETVVEPARQSDRGALHVALTELAAQDPLIGLRGTSVSLYGEVQKEVIQTTLAEEYGVEVKFRETTPICVERLLGVGEALAEIKVGDNPFLATVGLRVAPAPIGSGVSFGIEIEPGSLPPAFLTAIEESARSALGTGLHGWDVPDCAVTVTRTGYWARQSHSHATFDKSMSSTAGDFRSLTPLVLMKALAEAGTEVHEPMHAFRLELPTEVLGTALPMLTTFGAVPHSTEVRGEVAVVEGTVPAAKVHALSRRIPGLTGGEGVLESAFDHYARVA